MTNLELKNEFLIGYNAIATNSSPGLDDYEISVFLTKAQLELIKDYYNPDGNKYKQGFEASEKRRNDLEELIKDYKSTTKVTSTTGISSASQFFKIPDDVFLIIHEDSIVSSTDCFNNNHATVYVKTHDEYKIQSKNPFKKPDGNSTWRLNVAKIGVDNVVELVNPYVLSGYNLRYIKYPKPIVLSDLTIFLEGLSIDGVTAVTQCELNQSMHREIIDRAIELALRDYKPSGLESKVQLDLRNE